MPENAQATLVMNLRKATGLSLAEAKRYAETAHHDLLQRILRAGEYQQCGHLHDPIEDDLRHAAVIAAASRQAEIETDVEWQEKREELAATGHDTLATTLKRGRARALWSKKKQILAEHGLQWFSPAEMNPGTVFD